jgi:hypothetical protein
MSEHRIDKLFRKSLEGRQERPSPAAWEAIRRTQQKNRILWWRYAAAVALLCVAAWGGYRFVQTTDHQTAPLAAGHSKAQIKPAEIVPAPADDVAKADMDDKPDKVEQMHDEAVSPATPLAEAAKAGQNKSETASGKAEVPAAHEAAPAVAGAAVKELNEKPAYPETPQLAMETGQAGIREAADNPVDVQRPKVRIVYKKGNEAAPPVASANILKKSIKKVNDITDELKPDDRILEKIQSTGEDILALNIGRLFTKNSDENEN